MNEPWFNPNLYAWIPGTFLGVLGGVVGSLAGIFASRGTHRRLVFGAIWFAVLYSAICLVAAVFALVQGQPYGIWYGLGLPGVLGLVIFGANTPTVFRAYRMAEERRMQAQDLET
ncbi:MAG TPA: hypothetical protein VGY53_10645 [Isosphaeraceae bacterium]|jgi:multidrug transporter EmrE-like cation transporter|nr:hypothetical protein [Isosphaeraceae bacterium]